MKQLFIIVSLLISLQTVKAENFSMRDCMLLPIVDNAGEVMGYKLYDEVESYLRRSKWCDYKSSSSVLSVFSKYRDRLKTHLEDPKVIKTVANRVKSGSLIKVLMDFDVDSVVLKLEILSENGDEIYFKESQKVSSKLPVITETLVSWLEIYAKQIPYHSKVIGILGEQLTFDEIGLMQVGQEFELRRFKKKKNHKLLKTVVQWESDLIGKGKVYSINGGQGLGIVKVYYGRQRARTGDWIHLVKLAPNTISDKEFFPKFAKGDFGKLGEVTVSFLLSNSSTTTNPPSNNIRYGGFLYGLAVKGEAWITREYFALLELSRTLGSYDKEGGVAQESSPSTINGVFKIGGGFKYLPMGFFFGPRVNIYGGYGSYSYGLDQSAADGIGEGVIKGLFVGLGGDMPLKKGIRAFGNVELMPFASFKDEDGVYSGSDSVRHLSFELGGKYKYNKVMDLEASIEVNNGSSKFSGSGVSKVEYKDTILKAGVGFIF